MCGCKSITTHCRAAKNGSIEEVLMARTFVALGLFLATSIGFAGPVLAQYNNLQYKSPASVQQPENLPR
jgi:hypothetical protein